MPPPGRQEVIPTLGSQEVDHTDDDQHGAEDEQTRRRQISDHGCKPCSRPSLERATCRVRRVRHNDGARAYVVASKLARDSVSCGMSTSFMISGTAVHDQPR